MQVTSLEELKQMAEGELIPLPRFQADKPLVVRVKRVSMLSLIQKGTIPNSLLSAAEELFYGKKASKGVDMKELTNVMTIMAENTLVEPSIQDFKNVGLELNDEQLVALFNYSQEGLKKVIPSDPQSKDNVDNSNSQAVQSETESSTRTE